MATTDYDFALARDAIIAAAYQKIGAIPQGATPTSAQISAASDKLNVLIKSWETELKPLWGFDNEIITLVAGTSNYAVGSDANLIGLQAAFYRTTDSGGKTSDTPLRYISWEAYQAIPEKLDSGEPTDIAVDPISKNIYLYPVPNVADKVFVSYLVRFKDWDSSSSTGDIPPEATRALLYGLAAELADDFKLSLSERSFLRNEAKTSLAKLKAWTSSDGDFHFVRSAY